MDEVELAFVAKNYLKKLDYKIDLDNLSVKDKIVSFKNVRLNKNNEDSRKNIVINDVDVFIDNDLVLIMDTTSSYLFYNRRDFSRDEKSRLFESIISTKYSFTKVNDRVIKSCHKNVTNLINGKTISKLNNEFMDSIEVDNNYELTDGYPVKNLSKKLIKE